jgi:hypothetical protein
VLSFRFVRRLVHYDHGPAHRLRFHVLNMYS